MEPIIEKLRNMGREELPTLHSLIFGFGHRARNGKDTVAAMIKEHRGDRYNIESTSFAAELKREVNQAALAAGGMQNLWDPSMFFYQENGNMIQLAPWVLYEPQPDMSDPLCPLGKQRTLLQWWGTEYRRNANPDYWVQRVHKVLAERKPEIAFITDLRFPNEMSFVQTYGNAVKVYRPGLPSPNAHPSEEALAGYQDHNWDWVILNDGTLEDLKRKALYAFDSLMEMTQQ